jgi:hypothetical protein
MHKKMEYTRPAPGVDVNAPLIYMWEVKDGSDAVIGRYIGKANGGERRPTRHYTRNVNKLLRGQAYKKGKNYRRVHYALADAVNAGHSITLSYLCNVPSDQDIFKVETRYIREYGCDKDDGIGLNGRWPGPPRQVVLADTLVPAHEATHPRYKQDDSVTLEDFLECVEANPGAFTVKSTPHRYTLWIGDDRILRAKQRGRDGKVRIKLVQTEHRLKKHSEFTWDGSDEQIAAALDSEFRLFMQHQKN